MIEPSSPDSPPKRNVYDMIGGESAVRALVQRFYQLMDSQPEAWEIRQLHPESLAGSEEKLFMYLSGYLGGPNLYIEKFGHPRLRARHLPFPIGMRERDQWLNCMEQALIDTQVAAPVKDALMKALTDLADFMRNKSEADAPQEQNNG